MKTSQMAPPAELGFAIRIFLWFGLVTTISAAGAAAVHITMPGVF